MNKEEKFNSKDVRNQIHEAKKMNTPEISKKKKNKDLPWWVELLFVHNFFLINHINTQLH